ncbi:hypothetical protein ACIA6T_21705 [Streptomyces sp. NPDC051740]|uniref:hypothetical protein n=1 Tax=Streptomyces sp. NPDC051740 TaxID=3365673 RepID=UPI00379CE1EE
MRFTSTPRGARLARHLVAVRLDAWGIPYGTNDHDAIVLIVAESPSCRVDGERRAARQRPRP